MQRHDRWALRIHPPRDDFPHTRDVYVSVSTPAMDRYQPPGSICRDPSRTERGDVHRADGVWCMAIDPFAQVKHQLWHSAGPGTCALARSPMAGLICRRRLKHSRIDRFWLQCAPRGAPSDLRPGLNGYFGESRRTNNNRLTRADADPLVAGFSLGRDGISALERANVACKCSHETELHELEMSATRPPRHGVCSGALEGASPRQAHRSQWCRAPW